MKIRTFYILASVFLMTATGCNNDDGRSCTSCSSEQTPEFELCRESNGNASVNGENTGIEYDDYLADLQAAGSSCGL